MDGFSFTMAIKLQKQFKDMISRRIAEVREGLFFSFRSHNTCKLSVRCVAATFFLLWRKSLINHRLASGPCFRINGSEKMRKREERGRIPWVMKNFHAAIISRSGRVEHNYWMNKKL